MTQVSPCCQPFRNIHDRIVHIVKGHGAPLFPDRARNQATTDKELCGWYNSYYPRSQGQWNDWTLVREAFRVRAEAREGTSSTVSPGPFVANRC